MAGFLRKSLAFVQVKELFASIYRQHLDAEIEGVLEAFGVEQRLDLLTVPPHRMFMSDELLTLMIFDAPSSLMIFEDEDAQGLGLRSGTPGENFETLALYIATVWISPWRDNPEGIDRLGRPQEVSEYMLWCAEVMRAALIECVDKYLRSSCTGVELVSLESTGVQNQPITGPPQRNVTEARLVWRVEIDAQFSAPVYSP